MISREGVLLRGVARGVKTLKRIEGKSMGFVLLLKKPPTVGFAPDEPCIPNNVRKINLRKAPISKKSFFFKKESVRGLRFFWGVLFRRFMTNGVGPFKGDMGKSLKSSKNPRLCFGKTLGGEVWVPRQSLICGGEF